jgi:hypothetical protein
VSVSGRDLYLSIGPDHLTGIVCLITIALVTVAVATLMLGMPRYDSLRIRREAEQRQTAL